MEIIVNQDIRKFKTKDIGNFSFKEIGFLVAAAGLAYGTYYLQKNIFMLEQVSTFPCILLAAIPLLFGFFKPQGMTFMEFLKTVVKENMIDPKVYVWESDYFPDMNAYGDLIGEDYALTPERQAQVVQMVESMGIQKSPKPSKEEQAKIIR